MIEVLSHSKFDDKMKEMHLDDSNVESLKDYAFISIIGTKECLEKYLHEANTEHFFKSNHDNVINLDFDDVDSDCTHEDVHFRCISKEQALELVNFIDVIAASNCKNIYIHCRAGISRSRAVAEYIARHYSIQYDGSERKLSYNHLNHGVLRRLEWARRSLKL